MTPLQQHRPAANRRSRRPNRPAFAACARDILLQSPLRTALGEHNVLGRGQWATLPDGTVYSRVLRDGRYYCDVCAADPDNPPLGDLFA